MACTYQPAPLMRGAAEDRATPNPSEGASTADRNDPREAREAARGSPYLSSKEAARYLGVTDRSLQNMRRRGAGPHFIRFGRQVRYHIRDLLAYARDPSEPGEYRG